MSKSNAPDPSWFCTPCIHFTDDFRCDIDRLFGPPEEVTDCNHREKKKDTSSATDNTAASAAAKKG